MSSLQLMDRSGKQLEQTKTGGPGTTEGQNGHTQNTLDKKHQGWQGTEHLDQAHVTKEAGAGRSRAGKGIFIAYLVQWVLQVHLEESGWGRRDRKRGN